MSLKTRLSGLFSESMGECLQTSKEFRRTMRDRVLQIVEEEVVLRVGAHEKDRKSKDLDRGWHEEERLLRKVEELTIQRDEALVQKDVLQNLVSKYKTQLEQLKEVARHHRAVAEGGRELADGYCRVADGHFEGIARGDIYRERERILKENNKMLEGRVAENEKHISELARSNRMLEQESQAAREMIEGLRRELQVSGHALVAERRRVQELELRVARDRGDCEVSDSSFSRYERQNLELKHNCAQYLSREQDDIKTQKIVELEAELEAVRKEAGDIARGVGDDLSKLRKQVEYLQEENLGMSSEVRRLRGQLLEADYALQDAINSKPTQSAPFDRRNIQWILCTLSDQISNLKQQLARTQRLQTEELAVCKETFSFKLHTLLTMIPAQHRTLSGRSPLTQRNTQQKWGGLSPHDTQSLGDWQGHLLSKLSVCVREELGEEEKENTWGRASD